MKLNAAHRLVASTEPGDVIAPSKDYGPKNSAEQSTQRSDAQRPTRAAHRLLAEDLNDGNIDPWGPDFMYHDTGPQSGVAVSAEDTVDEPSLEGLDELGETGGFDPNPMWNKASQPVGFNA